MKKLLLVFTVAAFLTACNGHSSSSETTTTTDTTTTVTPPSDSAVAPAKTDSSMTKTTDLSAMKISADSPKK